MQERLNDEIIRKEGNAHIYWRVRCHCGEPIIARATDVRRGFFGKCRICSSKIRSDVQKKHGLRKSPTYSTWSSMKNRATCPSGKDWAKYGAVGIGMDERWNDFQSFIADMGMKPAGMSLDRIDNTKGYSKENCRWATKQTQQRNKRTSKIWHIKGKTYLTLKEAAEDNNVRPTTVHRWVIGMFDKRRGKTTPPRNDCYSEFIYGAE